jgi:hypothetical protein
MCRTLQSGSCECKQPTEISRPLLKCYYNKFVCNNSTGYRIRRVRARISRKFNKSDIVAGILTKQVVSQNISRTQIVRSIAYHAIHLHFDISSYTFEIRAVEGPKCYQSGVLLIVQQNLISPGRLYFLVENDKRVNEIL